MAVSRSYESLLQAHKNSPSAALNRRPGLSNSPTTVVTMKASPGPKRKLPKMNPSERAKYYRRRIREYMAGLETTDHELKQHVDNLEIIRDVQQRLAHSLEGGCRQRVLAHVWQFLDRKQYLEQHILSGAQFRVRDVSVVGEPDRTILALNAEIRGVYSKDTIEKQLYTFVPGNTLLLAKLLRSKMVFQCSFRFYFNADGALIQQTSETDFVTGLLQSIGGSLTDTRRLLAALGDPQPLHKIFDGHASVPPLPFMEAQAIRR